MKLLEIAYGTLEYINKIMEANYMAMMDYGAIAFKNGKLISTGMFTPMIDMVGWEDTEKDMYHNYNRDIDEQLKLNGNYFAYIGDADCTVAFYKTGLRIVQKFEDEFWNESEWFNNSYYTWSKWKNLVAGNYMKVTKRNGYYVFKWKYKGDKYKVYFGYGVDLHSYKKHRIVNFYRSPIFIIKSKIPRWFKNMIYDFKYCR
jgi:hypothetical protein